MQRMIMDLRVSYGYNTTKFIAFLAKVFVSIVMVVLNLALLFGLAVGAIYAYRYLLSL